MLGHGFSKRLHSLGTCRVFFKPQTIKTYSFSIHCQVLLIFLWDYTSVIRSIIISPKKTFVFLFMNTRKKNLFMSHVATCHFFGIQNTGEHDTLRTNSMRGHITFISLVFLPSTVCVPSSFDTTTLYLSSKHQQPQRSLFSSTSLKFIETKAFLISN